MADNIDISTAFDAIFEDDGVNEQEVAEPVEEEEIATAEGDGEEIAEEQEITEPAESQQSAEENAKFAQMRRRYEQEREQAVQQAQEAMRQTMQQEYAQMFGALGLVSPYTGKPVETAEEFAAYAKAISDDKAKEIEAKMKDSGVTEEEFKAIIEQHPDVKKARETNDRLESLERKMKQEADTKYLQAELEVIREFDPTIRGYEDIVKDPRHEEFTAMVKRGYRISDAYMLLHKEDILNRQAELSRREALNTVRGKEHLKKSASHGDAEYVATAEEINEFKQLNPNATTEDIRKFIARDRARMKK